MKRYLTIYVFLGIITSCSPKNDPIVVHFSREDFKQQVLLVNPEEIVLYDSLDIVNPVSFFLLQDTLLLVQNQPRMPFALELFSLHNLQSIAQLAPMGRGPGEFLTCTYMGCSVDQSKIYLQDRQTHSFYKVDLDRTIENKKIEVEQQFYYDPEIHPYTPSLVMLDSCHYTGYNMWYLDDTQFNNKVPALTKYHINPPQIESSDNLDDPFMGHSYFVGPVNGARLVLTPDKEKIWLLDYRRDRIEIYNDSLVLLKTIHGPDHYKVQYVSQNAEDTSIQMIVFAEGKEYMAYTDYAYNHEHIYIVYVGTDSYQIDNLPSVEIFKLDWDGNMLCNYKLDRFLYSISVDSKEEYLYGTSRKSFYEDPQFIRYTIK